MLQKSKQIFVVPSVLLTKKSRVPPKVQSHNRANNKYLPLKTQINVLFTVKSLHIPNICCTFAAAKVFLEH